MAFVLAPENIAFVSAILLMVLIGLVQLLGLGGDADFDLDADTDLLGWLGFGRIPFLMLVTLLLASFGIIGLLGQQLSTDLLGHLIDPWVAAPAALVAALPVTGVTANLLARVMPRDHTTAISVEELVGNGATIVTGRARAGSPARARVIDHHGQVHFVMVEPNEDGQVLEEGESVLLVRHEGPVFRAVSRGDHYLPRI